MNYNNYKAQDLKAILDEMSLSLNQVKDEIALSLKSNGPKLTGFFLLSTFVSPTGKPYITLGYNSLDLDRLVGFVEVYKQEMIQKVLNTQEETESDDSRLTGISKEVTDEELMLNEAEELADQAYKDLNDNTNSSDRNLLQAYYNRLSPEAREFSQKLQESITEYYTRNAKLNKDLKETEGFEETYNRYTKLYKKTDKDDPN